MSRGIHPTFLSKKVIRLECKYCEKCICSRGMKALLLADTEVELYSTDLPPPNAIALIGRDYSTKNCDCRIKDVACLGCGNVVGYHVVLPCKSCLESCNNGHFWMFHSNATESESRLDPSGTDVMVWGTLPPCYEDHELCEDLLPEFECLR